MGDPEGHEGCTVEVGTDEIEGATVGIDSVPFVGAIVGAVVGASVPFVPLTTPANIELGADEMEGAAVGINSVSFVGAIKGVVVGASVLFVILASPKHGLKVRHTVSNINIYKLRRYPIFICFENANNSTIGECDL